MPLTAYYAHPMSLYGTAREAADVALIESMGFSVLNPNTPKHQEACREMDNPMDYFLGLVRREADVLVFRAFPDLSIGAGIVGEARALGKAVLEIPTDFDGRALSVPETRERNSRYRGDW